MLSALGARCYRWLQLAGESPQSNNDSVTGCVDTSTDRKKDTAAPMPDNQILQLQPHTSVPIKMSTMQAQVHEAGLKAAAEARGQEAPKDSPAVDKALDPSSDFPEKPLEPTKAEGEGMQNVDQMAVRAPVAGKKGQGDLKGDAVGGINRGVGEAMTSLGDTEGGRKGIGVDFSNAAGMGGA